MRLIDAATGEPLLRGEEALARYRAAEQRAQAAEEELARLRSELEPRR